MKECYGVRTVQKHVFDTSVLKVGKQIIVAEFLNDGFERNIYGTIQEIEENKITINYDDGEWSMIHEVTIDEILNGEKEIIR